MRDNRMLSVNLDDRSSFVMPGEPLLSPNSGAHILSHLSPYVDNSLCQSRFLYIRGSMAFQEAFICMSKVAGGLLFWFTGASSSTSSQQLSSNQHGPRPGNDQCSSQVKNITATRPNLTGFRFGSKSKQESSSPQVLGTTLSFMMRLLRREVGRLQSFSVLSLASSLVPPFGHLSSKMLAVPVENVGTQLQTSMDRRLCEVGHHGSSSLRFHDLNWTRLAVEPKTGIEFPIMLDMFAGGNKSNITSEVLVGTGSRTMKIIKIKSLKVYAFGFYIHPNSISEKLGPKYASVPEGELIKSRDFYEDLLREDIGMTVRLVTNCNGMKINTVRNAFEKSLRKRLVKTNPNTDYSCLKTFGSLFSKDIQIPQGTTVEFRRTADGKLITEIGGNQIGAVHSKDLCRAFFDMYIGESPVSEQAKEEIGKNVATIMRRC